jgi:prepilin-type N-terminal cleavage/methylation domain-containing protein
MLQIIKIKNMQKTDGSQSGFTLIELLVVIGILAILLAITLIAINPNKHFEDVRNTQRSSNVGAILDGIYEYESSNSGNEPAAVANVGALPLEVGESTSYSATNTTFSASQVTLTGLSSNTITSGNVLISGCANSANDGDFAVVSGNGTTLVVTNPSGGAGDTSCAATKDVNLCSALAPTYVADLPVDPKTGTVTGGATPCASATTAYDTGYTIASVYGRFTVAAPAAEDGQVISVTR